MLFSAKLSFYKKGAIVYQAGQYDKFIYVILRGSVNVVKVKINQYNERDKILLE